MKSKSVLVIDTPDNCITCPLFVRKDIEGDYECKLKDYDGLPIFFKDGNIDRPTWCPLLPLPEAINLRQYVDNAALDLQSILAYQYAQGWNNCLYEIQKGK